MNHSAFLRMTPQGLSKDNPISTTSLSFQECCFLQIRKVTVWKSPGKPGAFFFDVVCRVEKEDFYAHSHIYIIVFFLNFIFLLSRKKDMWKVESVIESVSRVFRCVWNWCVTFIRDMCDSLICFSRRFSLCVNSRVAHVDCVTFDEDSRIARARNTLVIL